MKKRLSDTYKKWQLLLEKKRAATRQAMEKKISAEQAKVEESIEEIDEEIKRLLSGI